MGLQSFDWWKVPLLWGVGKVIHSASMGPQSFDCGKLDNAIFTITWSVLGLVFGRDLVASMGPQSFDSRKAHFNGERRRPCNRERASNGAAVFQLRKVDAQNQTLRLRMVRSQPASMGPQSFNCGKTDSACRLSNGRELLVIVASMGPQSFNCGNGRRHEH